jgi:hypothetical protein
LNHCLVSPLVCRYRTGGQRVRVHFPNPTRLDPAIYGLSVASKNFRDLRDSQIFALWRSKFCCLPAQDRLPGCLGLGSTGEEFSERSEEPYRKWEARLQTGRTIGFSYISDSQKVCNVQIWHAHFMDGVFQRNATFNRPCGPLMKKSPRISRAMNRGPTIRTSLKL